MNFMLAKKPRNDYEHNKNAPSRILRDGAFLGQRIISSSLTPFSS